MGINKRDNNVNARLAGASKMAMPRPPADTILQQTARFVRLEMVEGREEGPESVEMLRNLRRVYRVREKMNSTRRCRLTIIRPFCVRIFVRQKYFG